MGRMIRSRLIYGQLSKLVNSDLHNFDSGAESAAALQPRATPWVSESIGAPCKAEESSALAGRNMDSDTFPGRCPGLACSAPLARYRGCVLERRKLLRSDL